MAYTMQQLVDRARIPLNDADKDRYSDADLLGYAVDALAFVAAKRPDLLVGTAWAPAYSAYTLGSSFPFSDRYFPLVADYVTGRAELVDDEFTTEGRAAMLMANFENKLVTP